MDLLVQMFGIGLVILALVDIYLTVLYPRLGSSFLSWSLNKSIWWLLRLIARAVPCKSAQLLSHSGSIMVIVIVVVWVALLVCGFALLIWSELNDAIRASQGQTPTNFATALYYSGYSFTTLGTGDILPKTDTYRLLMFLQAALGFSTFTLAITYLLSVYSALIRRNTFALSLHHRTAGTADAAELLAGLGASGELSNAQQDISNIARDLMNLLESQHSYPVLLYFRFPQTYYALPRVLFLALDTVTLIRSALNPQKHPALVRSTAVSELWGGSLQLLTELSSLLLPKHHPNISNQQEQAWRERYYQAVARLKAEGIATATDLEAGANKYICLRRKWQPSLLKLTDYMAYDWTEVATAQKSMQ